MKSLIRSLLPDSLLRAYHFALAYLGAAIYGFPSRKLTVIAVTGTKGKSTTTELVAALLRAHGKKVASTSTIQFTIAEKNEPNLYKMGMPGRFFMHRFLRRALQAGCTHAVLEMTSEGARYHRHRGIELDALVFTNLTPEHIESHGSLEAYVAAKLSLAHALERSPKRPRIIVANADDAYGHKFLAAQVEIHAPFSLTEASPASADDKGARFVWRGTLFTTTLPGLFNLQNTLAALTLCEALGVPREVLQRALSAFPVPRGRAERIEQGQPFSVIVDYAHTQESLKAIFETYKQHRLLCVFGATGGGRDKWKRSAMGKIADEYCEVSVLTDDDSYDEDPTTIAHEIAAGFSRTTPLIEPDRRKAIRTAFAQATAGDVVLLLGKGTDPYLMGKKGSKLPWSDARVAQEELQKLGYT